MNDLDRHAPRGMQALFGRQAAVQILTFAGGVVLARTLRPAEFGLYFIAAFLVNAVAALGDFGLGPSLIQRKEDVGEQDLRAAFTLQLTATSVLVAIIVGIAPWLAAAYPHAPHETVWLVRALAFNFFLTTWRSVAFLQLERHLRFRRVALIEVVEALMFQGVAVVLALAGAGVWSFVCATIASGVAGTGLAWASARWRIGLAFDRERFRELLRFGVPYQAQMVLNSVGGWASIVLMGALFGPRGVGLITWASANGRKPSVFLDSVSRVAFPHLSRQQDEVERVERTLARYLGSVLFAAAFWTALIVVAAPGLVPLVYTKRWTPAVPALMIFAVALVFDTVCSLFVVALNSRGRPTYVARVVLVRSLLLAGLAAAFGYWVGFVGFAIAHLATSVLTTLLLGRQIPGMQRILASVKWLIAPPAAAVAAGLAIVALPIPEPLRSLLAAVVVGIAYAGVSWRFLPRSLLGDISATLPRIGRARATQPAPVTAAPAPSPLGR